MRSKLVLAMATMALALPSAASADDHFGRLFPQLPALTGESNQQLADLAGSMLDPAADSENNCPPGTEQPPFGCVGSGFTYLGQFLDHDLTLDTAPPPTTQVDPRTLVNHRTFRFDLDSVYGDGPVGSPQLYAADGAHFKLPPAYTLPGLPDEFQDLPRNPDGSAILIEGRNDENQVIAQIHVAFLRAHNKLIDEGHSFVEARRILTAFYQRMIMSDYLPHVLGSRTVGPEALRLADGMTPVEFSVAAFRFGHSQVRPSYFLNDSLGVRVPVFDLDPSVDQLSGGKEIGAHAIEWKYFFPELQDPDDAEDVSNANISRKIDTLISAPLFALPIPGAEATGSNVLAFRNMTRSKFYGLPSGQDVAQAIGVKPLTNAQLAVPVDASDFARKCVTRSGNTTCTGGVPLWYYVLREASVRENGQRLGPVGSRIVGETFGAVLARDSTSVLRGSRGVSVDEIAGDDGAQFSDLLVFDGLAERPEG